MPHSAHQWKYLERRPGSSYLQLCVKGKRIWAWTLYCEFMNAKEPRTENQLALDFDLPLEAVQEAIEYGKSDPPEIREDQRRDAVLAEAIGMNDPSKKRSGKPRQSQISA
jgi:uncharacterized protein (DUF433 family)